MAEQVTDLQHEAAELFGALPPEIQTLALNALHRLGDRDRYTGAFGWLLGIHYNDRANGHVQCSLEVDESHFNPAQVAHGGVVYALIDSAMGAAVFTQLEPSLRCVTAELKINYIRPILPGTIIARANVVHIGKTLAVVNADARNADNELLAVGMGTFAIIERR